MIRLWASLTFRIALLYGVLMMASLAVISAVFYYGTVVVQARDIDRNLEEGAQSLSGSYKTHGRAGLQKEIEQLLDDGINQDTEVYLLLDPQGHKLAGNLIDWQADAAPLDTLVTESVQRYGRPSLSRLLWHHLPDGATLVVGRDLHDKQRIRSLVWRSLAVGGGIALLLIFAGALLFRRQFARNLSVIRRTALEVQSGNLSQRIPVTPAEDEFTRLSRDINHMLDRIEQLMDGVRHVSNTIAHNLRTPLGRTRAQLEEALRHHRDATPVSEAAAAAIQDIDALILVFERLLQIAEAESGARRRPFEAVDLRTVVTDVVELYDAMAETRDMALSAEMDDETSVLGDRHLLSAALANLVENAIKYADGSPTIRVSVREEPAHVIIEVEDHGPGIPADAIPRVTERFYRLESRVPGSGLGLSIVTAIANMHRGTLRLDDAAPGLRARIILPREGADALPDSGIRI
ncbi:MAG TPA: HAMP domain-containing sensor histidine kinase [Gammaproteobacteria bacterium]|jgi:signal transduction histidine kinase|nr:HAMP domain-containing sensor histidine kinase [Gammaproteobacteria bacterium]